jgi:hypothetical protein
MNTYVDTKEYRCVYTCIWTVVEQINTDVFTNEYWCGNK